MIKVRIANAKQKVRWKPMEEKKQEIKLYLEVEEQLHLTLCLFVS